MSCRRSKALVKSAVGFNPGRGDQVTVANIPFQDMAADGGEGGKFFVVGGADFIDHLEKPAHRCSASSR